MSDDERNAPAWIDAVSGAGKAMMSAGCAGMIVLALFVIFFLFIGAVLS